MIVLIINDKFRFVKGININVSLILLNLISMFLPVFYLIKLIKNSVCEEGEPGNMVIIIDTSASGSAADDFRHG